MKTGFAALATLLVLLAILPGCAGKNTEVTLPSSPASLVITREGQEFAVAHAHRVRVGAYELKAVGQEDVKIANLTIVTGADGASFRNLHLLLNGSPFGAVQSFLSSGTAYTYSGALTVIPKGRAVKLDILADVPFHVARGEKPLLTTLAGCTAFTAYSATSLRCPIVTGQHVIVRP